LAELLQTASSQLDGEQSLVRWLAQQIDETRRGNAAESDDRTVRLESDEDLVKVITIHASKGLEYPVVCLPFAHSHREVTAGKAAVMQVGEAGARHWTLVFDQSDAQGADHDRLREDLRLWYVALTRARHALWVGWSPVKRGNGQTCVNHDSAAGHLLSGGAALEASDWWPRWQALQTDAQGQALSVQFTAAPTDVPLTRWQRTVQRPALREALVCTARIDKRWGIASFSRLTRDLASQTWSQPVLQPTVQPLLQSPFFEPLALASGTPVFLQTRLDLIAPRPADDEPQDEAPNDAALFGAQWPPESSTQLAVATSRVQAPWHHFPRGPSAGNFLHDQMEWLASEGFALLPGTVTAERLAKRCERAGHKAQAQGVVQWLARLVAQPLAGPNVALNALSAQHQVLPEMEFWLPAERLLARDIDALCQQHLLPGVARPQLPDAQLHGMLMGFADLVFEHAGRYWVLDYKSNHLGTEDAAYTAQALDAAMAQHRYEVQAALYLLALHRLLRARLGAAYDPAQHLGGAVYVFMRGIDGPAGGCCTLPAPLALMAGLDAMLGAS
jgi:exodeoxyribonuclease V beta subunit